MQTTEILAAIDEEISRLQQVRSLLAGNPDGRGSRGRRGAAIPATAFPFGAGQAPAPRKPRKLSAAGRARIAAAQKARWAKQKKASSQKDGAR